MDNFNQEFQIESGSQLDSIFHDVSELKNRINHGPTRRTLVGSIFRKVHTLKGAASTAGYESTARIAQAVESLLDRIRKGELLLKLEIFEVLSEGVSILAESLREGFSDSDSALVESTIARLHSAKNHTANGSEALIHDVLAHLPSDIARSLSLQDRQRLRENITEGARIAVLAISLELDSFDDKFREISAHLNECGEILSTLPGIDEGAFDTINFRILHAATIEMSQLRERIERFGKCSIQELGSEPHKTGVQPSKTVLESDHTSFSEFTVREYHKSELVPIPLDDLKDFVAAADAIADAGISAVEAVRLYVDESNIDEFEELARKIREQFDSYKEQAYLITTVPIHNSFSRAEMVCQSAAHQAGKSIEFHFEPTDIRVDIGLAKTINDCLLHLVNNAVFHGVEDDTTRLNAGKRVPGKIVLCACIEDSNVRVSIKDDGAGLDLEKISKIAFERGLIPENKSMSDEEGLELITQPGFTTSDMVSRIAGRGVGLDVVRQLVESASGSLRVKTIPGVGTTFEMIFNNPRPSLTASRQEAQE